jgi:hypothetical protein
LTHECHPSTQGGGRARGRECGRDRTLVAERGSLGPAPGELGLAKTVSERPERVSHSPEWDEDTDAELPYDFDRTRRYFEAANGGVAVGAG